MSKVDLDGIDIESHIESGNIEKVDGTSAGAAKLAAKTISNLESLATDLQKQLDEASQRVSDLETVLSEKDGQIAELLDANEEFQTLWAKIPQDVKDSLKSEPIPEASEFDKMTVEQLKEEAKSLGIDPVPGKKQELVDAITAKLNS